MKNVIDQLRNQTPFFQVLILICFGLVLSVILGMIMVSIYAGVQNESLLDYPYLMAKEQPIAFMLVNQVPFQLGMFLIPGIIYRYMISPGKSSEKPRNIMWTIGLFVAVFLLMPFLSEINLWIVEQSGFLEKALVLKENSDRIIENVTVGQSSFTLLVAVVVIAVLTGFAEEFFFRGFVYHHMSVHSKNKWVAVIVSALFFAVLHFNYVQLLPLLSFGVALALIYEFSKSIYIGVALHAINNALSLFWLYTDSFPAFMKETSTLITVFGLFGLVVLLWLKRSDLRLK